MIIFRQQQPQMVRPFLRWSIPEENPYPNDDFVQQVLPGLFSDETIKQHYSATAIRRTDLPPDLPWIISFTANELITRIQDNPRFELHKLAD